METKELPAAQVSASSAASARAGSSSTPTWCCPIAATSSASRCTASSCSCSSRRRTRPCSGASRRSRPTVSSRSAAGEEFNIRAVQEERGRSRRPARAVPDVPGEHPRAGRAAHGAARSGSRSCLPTGGCPMSAARSPFLSDEVMREIAGHNVDGAASAISRAGRVHLLGRTRMPTESRTGCRCRAPR